MDYIVKGAKAIPFTFTWLTKAGAAYDLSSTTLLETIFIAPDGTQVPKTATTVGAANLGISQSTVDFTSGTAGASVGNATGPWKALGHFQKANDEKFTLPIEFYLLDVGQLP